jgi:hypothetical protein
MGISRTHPVAINQASAQWATASVTAAQPGTWVLVLNSTISNWEVLGSIKYCTSLLFSQVKYMGGRPACDILKEL